MASVGLYAHSIEGVSSVQKVASIPLVMCLSVPSAIVMLSRISEAARTANPESITFYRYCSPPHQNLREGTHPQATAGDAVPNHVRGIHADGLSLLVQHFPREGIGSDQRCLLGRSLSSATVRE